jgi:hypothetical protein
MDLSHILIQTFASMLSAYWWMIPFIIMLSILKTPFMKGVIILKKRQKHPHGRGEYRPARALSLY